MQKYIIHSDGGSRGNPGPAAYGYTIKPQVSNPKSQTSFESQITKNIEGSKYIGEATNNQAEYSGVVAALENVKNQVSNLPCGQAGAKNDDLEIQVFLDSQLIVEQMNGRYKIKNEGLKPLFWRIKELIIDLGNNVTFEYIPREKNKEADRLVNEAIDKFSSNTTNQHESFTKLH